MLLLFYADWQAWGIGALQLGTVAVLHTIGAFLMLIFLIVHIYFATTGHTPLAHIKAMITGWDEVEDEHAAAK
jgi:thiosulfate reductase cytochrome b subunit